MPLTPRFGLSQTASHVVLSIHVPYTRKISGMELVIVEATQINL
jgi:hypothetical protein